MNNCRDKYIRINELIDSNNGFELELFFKENPLELLRNYLDGCDDITKLKFIMDLFPDLQYNILYICIFNNKYDLVEFILTEYKIDLTNDNNNMAIKTFCVSPDLCYSMIKLLVDHGSIIDADALSNLTVLKRQSTLDDKEMYLIIKLFLEHGSDIHAGDDYVLRQCSKACFVECVKLILENDGNVHANDDETLRFCGICDSRMLILDKIWPIFPTNSLTNCHDQQESCYQIVKLLLGHGADVSANNHQALILNINRGYSNIVKLLIEHGADLSQINNQQIFLSPNQIEMIKLLSQSNVVDPVSIFNIMTIDQNKFTSYNDMHKN